MTALGVVHLDPLTEQERRVWQEVVALGATLRPEQWMLIGGQMVSLYGAWAGRERKRVTEDIDVLANMELLTAHLQACTGALTSRGYASVPDSHGLVYRFHKRDAEASSVQIDLLVPDRILSKSARFGGPMMKIDGGTQALKRAEVVRLRVTDEPEAEISVPNLLGATVLKAAAWAADSRDPDRHAQDAAFLISLIDDIEPCRAQFTGSDRKRLRKLDHVLGDVAAEPWLLLEPADRELGFDNWRRLVD